MHDLQSKTQDFYSKTSYNLEVDKFSYLKLQNDVHNIAIYFSFTQFILMQISHSNLSLLWSQKGLAPKPHYILYRIHIIETSIEP